MKKVKAGIAAVVVVMVIGWLVGVVVDYRRARQERARQAECSARLAADPVRPGEKPWPRMERVCWGVDPVPDYESAVADSCAYYFTDYDSWCFARTVEEAKRRGGEAAVIDLPCGRAAHGVCGALWPSSWFR